MRWIAVLGVVVLLGTAACGGSDEKAGEITVGVLAPQTGFAANYGPEVQQGVDLALAQLGADELTVKIVTADEDVLDASQTLERLKKLVETDGAQIVLGPIFGSTQQAVAPYLSQEGIPWFSMLGASQELAGEGGSAFIWPGADELTAGPLGEYAASDLKYKRIATLAPDYAYGHAVIDGAVEQFEAAGGEVVQQQWVPLGTTDMLQYATNMDKSVDAVLMWLVPTDAASFVREYRNLGLKMPLLMHLGIFDPTFQEVGNLLVGEIGLNEYNPHLDNEKNKAFVSAYQAAGNSGVPNQTTAFAYTVMNVIAKAVQESGGDTSVDALRKALGGVALDTVIGPAQYTADGIASSPRVIVKAAKGADGTYVWEPLKTYENIGAPEQ